MGSIDNHLCEPYEHSSLLVNRENLIKLYFNFEKVLAVLIIDFRVSITLLVNSNLNIWISEEIAP